MDPPQASQVLSQGNNGRDNGRDNGHDNGRDEHPHEQPFTEPPSEVRPPETRTLAPPSRPDDGRRRPTRSSETLERYPSSPRDERHSRIASGLYAPLPAVPQSPSGESTRLRLNTLPPPRPVMPPPRVRTTHSDIDNLVPLKNEAPNYSVEKRLEQTLADAEKERDKSAARAKLMGWVLNVAIGLQVLLGALTTAVSAATATGTGRQAAISTAVLGGVATLVASYLARARGSGEPEVSAARAKDLDQFIRECKAFVTDNGYLTTGEVDAKIFYYRERLEELLGNIKGSAGRDLLASKPAPPV